MAPWADGIVIPKEAWPILSTDGKVGGPDSPQSLEKPGTAVSWELFDDQAASFESRAGLPAELCPLIAEAVLESGEVNRSDVVLEIGPGTGQIGIWIARAADYVGLDLSAGMLAEFDRRLKGAQAPATLLIRADAHGSWPLADGLAKLIFSSRALHLLPAEHVASEVFRTAAPGGATLVVGRVVRDRTSVRSLMAREMMQRLRSRGFEAHQGEHETKKLAEACHQRGGAVLERATVASWTVSSSPRQSIDSWRLLRGLGGTPVPEPIRESILSELEAWAEERFGGLDAQSESIESYVLRPVRIPSAKTD